MEACRAENQAQGYRYDEYVVFELGIKYQSNERESRCAFPNYEKGKEQDREIENYGEQCSYKKSRMKKCIGRSEECSCTNLNQ